MADEKEPIQEIRERLVKIETLLEVNNKDLFDRIKKLEDNQSWLIKTLAAAIIGGVIALYFK
ncbi:hemolysin XhlA family protein [Clostridium sp. SHJSY1]|uniref:hemolysin XhlA n=1 Tax=Clostridium sp. SHJSY1 TaxID=2942483 RepID=UPI00287630C1|nr:hemolysin XhlA [Clostridium sp. SHJSY1]MDS0525449.1 hemolysin XhlA family protein [Clostridium sp. SHJSY1]